MSNLLIEFKNIPKQPVFTGRTIDHTYLDIFSVGTQFHVTDFPEFNTYLLSYCLNILVLKNQNKSSRVMFNLYPNF